MAAAPLVPINDRLSYEIHRTLAPLVNAGAKAAAPLDRGNDRLCLQRISSYVILSERSESKNLRIFVSIVPESVRRSFDSPSGRSG